MVRSFVPTQRKGVVEICGDKVSYLQKTQVMAPKCYPIGRVKEDFELEDSKKNSKFLVRTQSRI